MKSLAALSLFCLLTACASMAPQQPISRMPFPESEYQFLPKSGDATVKGQAFLKTRGGEVKVAAGNEVILNPVTSYSKEWYEKSYLTGIPMTQPDSHLGNYVVKQVADGSGRFIFKNVPAGEYFVTTVITWEAATGYQGALQVQGGAVTKRIVVGNGDDLDVIITR
jgi:hypothetical protein